MAKKDKHVGETPATQALKRAGVAFTEHPYDYVEHGGTAESARQLGVDEHAIIKTLVMQDERAQPLVVLMHGDRQVSTKNLARAIGAKSVEPCRPDAAQRASGYLIGGTSPFGFKRKGVPVYVEASVLDLPHICINGGRRGFLVGIEPRVLTEVLGAKAVSCALARSDP
jgi:Cys-tRNA(Pro) deacylase